MTEERLQKVLAAAGVGSRRHCEDLIGAGRVTIDGEQVRRQGVRVDPDVAVVRVDGERVVTASGYRYLILNKPAGMVSTLSDERGRLSIADVPAVRQAGEQRRLFHVGRLDTDTEGLLLLTNDGDLAHRLMHPSFEVDKTYLAEVPGPVSAQVRRLLRAGVLLEDGPATVDAVRVLDSVAGRALLEVSLHEGRKHIVRRLLAAVDLPVRRLVRTQLGPVRLGSLKSGRTRNLSRSEVSALYRLVDLDL
ncbi:MAG TPA: pseudouridine synthase [Mycobacteriales bacterium]|jgi:23S rRNA pseudouridine2605 synthase|nr:pseudouridine synthase [Mycobacteriales bacterium]